LARLGNVTQRQTESRFFDDEAEHWSDLYVRDPQFKRRLQVLSPLIKEQVARSGGGRALDAGCGSGVFTALLARSGYKVLAVDESEAMLDAARRHCGSALADAEGSVEFRTASLEDLNVPARSFDVILCLSVLEYVADDAAALRQLGDAVTPGGVLVLSVPNRRGVVRTVERLINRAKRRDRGRYLDLQRHQYDPRQLDAELSEIGLQLARRRFFSVGFSRPRWLAWRLERGFWAGMYAAVYRAMSEGDDRPGHY
jgi:2-polyprenyl-3-methyl-5-hydroxy-6-metoxy-1,4-benzoquinol methylase